LTSNTNESRRILGSLRSEDGKGVVRIEDRFDTDIDDMWSALTDPGRLIGWLGDVEGELRVGGEFRARFHSSGWEGTGRVEACEPPRRWLVVTRDADKPDGPYDQAIEATLTVDGSQTILVWEERGLPVEMLAAFGAGIQLHIENLADYMAGRELREDAKARWEALVPAYQDLAADIST
jgi:uncharacterized protein YndB with AHSA1/START domain